MPMRVLMSGASGLIGRALARRLTSAGHEVVPLVRQEGKGGILWQPETGRFDRSSAEGADAVVHLAGEGVAAGRWTSARKQRIHDSRVRGTRLLCDGLRDLRRPPRVLAAASGVGFYGNGGETTLDESSSAGTTFLAKVCIDWEGACDPIRDRTRVVHVRTGIVLSSEGGALAQMAPIFKLGLGGRVGDGRQWMSWIGFEDMLRVYEAVLADDSIAGPVNGVAPNPVRNEEFARTLARALHRPAWIPAPAFALRTLLGAEMADELLLTGARVLPRRLSESGFSFAMPDLAGALASALAR